MSIPFQFASLYNGQEVCVWSDCLLDNKSINDSTRPHHSTTLRIHLFPLPPPPLRPPISSLSLSSACLPVSVYLSPPPSACLSVCLSFSPLPTCLSLSVCLSPPPSACLSVCLSLLEQGCGGKFVLRSLWRGLTEWSKSRSRFIQTTFLLESSVCVDFVS